MQSECAVPGLGECDNTPWSSAPLESSKQIRHFLRERDRQDTVRVRAKDSGV